MATALGETELAAEVRQRALRVRAAIERTYWLEAEGFYAFATWKPDGAAAPELLPENTVLQAVPLWWRLLRPERARRALEQVGSAQMATDWARGSCRMPAAATTRFPIITDRSGRCLPAGHRWRPIATKSRTSAIRP